MEIQKLLSGSNVRKGFQSCLRAKEFSAPAFRAIVVGTFLGITMGDVALFLQLRTSINYGQLPWYTTDVLIMTIGFLEALSSPFWSWFGRWRLRTLTFTTCLASVSALAMLTLPSVPLGSGSEFCSTSTPTSTAYNGMTAAGAVRLTIIILLALVNVVAKAATWNNSIVLLDIADPAKLSLHFGIVISTRVIVMLMFPRVLHDGMALWTQAVGVFAPLLIHAFQFYRLPEPDTCEKDLGYQGEIDTSFSGSLCRVLCSWLVVGQILSMALLAASLWGFSWHKSDMLKMLFFIVESNDFLPSQGDIFFHLTIVLAAVTYGIYFSRPAVFDKVAAMKLATKASIFLIPFYIVQTMVISCDTGLVAGLAQNYTQPACSSQCGCAAPYSAFEPVCVTDSLTSYMSPCHAGCVGQDTVEGLTVYTNCACAPATGARRAAVGACGAVNCWPAFMLHKALSICIIILTVLALQAQLVTILRSVEQRDRCLVVGLTTCVVLLFTFVGGHLAYFGIRVWTCAWSENRRCLFQSPAFLYAIGGTCIGLAAVSAVICLTTFLIIRRKTSAAREDIALDRTNNRDE